MRIVAAIVVGLLSIGQIQRAFTSDLPKVCQACDSWNAPRDPVRLFGNTFYVGTAGLSSVLITSPRGHILLDGGLPQSAEVIDRHIRQLGFRTEEVRLIVNSHGHYDHAGGIHALQRASGATVAASASGANALRRGENTVDDPQYGFGHESNSFPKVSAVRVVKDGEVLRVGPIAITAHLTPGHTPGSTTWTWRSCESSRCLDIVYADSLNAVSAPDFKYANEPARVAEFRKSITLVGALPCDLMVSVHPDFSKLTEKIERYARGEANAFVDPNACRAYASSMLEALQRRLADENK